MYSVPLNEETTQYLNLTAALVYKLARYRVIAKYFEATFDFYDKKCKF